MSGMAEQGVVIKIHFRVEREDMILSGKYEGIDFDQRRIGICRRPGTNPAKRPPLPPQPIPLIPIWRAMSSASWTVKPATGSINTLWIFSGDSGGDLLDIHAAFRARHQADAPAASVDTRPT